MKRLICIALCSALLLGLAPAALGDQQAVYQLLEDANTANNACTNVEEQLEIGTHTWLLMAELTARSLPGSEAFAPELDALMAQVQLDREVYGRDAGSRAANDLFAMVDVLALMALHMDVDGSFRPEIEVEVNGLNAASRKAPTLHDQQAYAAETALYLLSIIARELDVDGYYATNIQSLLDDHAASAAECRSPEHHLANSLYRAASMQVVIVLELDVRHRWSDTALDVIEDMAELDATCQSGYQQCINGCYRSLEAMAIMALTLN